MCRLVQLHSLSTYDIADVPQLTIVVFESKLATNLAVVYVLAARGGDGSVRAAEEPLALAHV